MPNAKEIRKNSLCDKIMPNMVTLSHTSNVVWVPEYSLFCDRKDIRCCQDDLFLESDEAVDVQIGQKYFVFQLQILQKDILILKLYFQ